MNRLATLLLVVALSVATAACSDDSEVGSGVDTSGLEGAGGAGAIRDTTTTTPPTTAPEAAPTTAPPTTARPAATTAPPTTAPPTTQAQPQIAATIGIYGDNSGKNQFEPRQVGVARGSTVRFQNFDSVARSVEDSGGAFRSPTIPPGGSWDYKANTAGTYNYSDGTRPYAVGQLVVG